MNNDKTWVVAGSIIGAISGGVPGFFAGAVLGSVIQAVANSPSCPNCNTCRMTDKGNFWQCPACGHIHNK